MNHDEGEREPINYHRIIQLQFDYVHLHQLTTSYDKRGPTPRESIDRSQHASSHTRLVYVAVHQTIPRSLTSKIRRNHTRNHVNAVRAKIGEEKSRDGGGARGDQVSKIVENLGPYGLRSKR